MQMPVVIVGAVSCSETVEAELPRPEFLEVGAARGAAPMRKRCRHAGKRISALTIASADHIQLS